MIKYEQDLFGDYLKIETNSSEKIKALDELFLKSAGFRKSKDYLDLLKFINHFPKLSPFNAFLIHTQNPGVEIVLPEIQWAYYNRTVKDNARPLVILVPFGPVNFVYDIADTEGDQIPEYLNNPFLTMGDFDFSIYQITINNSLKENISVVENEMNKTSAGFAKKDKSGFKIILNKSLGINEKYSTIVHELAHIFCGHLGSTKTAWWKDRTPVDHQISEIEAESISYLVCNRLGLQTGSDSYLADYISKNDSIPPISFDTVLTVSGHIEQMGTAKFKPKTKKA
jgi:hypothetical protein